MNRAWYRTLWALDIVAILIAALMLVIPIQDYAMRGFKTWYQHPSPQTLKAFQDKQQEEFHIRVTLAASVATTAILLGYALKRLRPRPTQSD
jgi:hypothetical protein